MPTLVSHTCNYVMTTLYKVPRVLTGAHKYLQTEFAKYGFASPYICNTVLTSLGDTKNAPGQL